MQEILFSRYVAVCCGETVFSFKVLSEFSLFFLTSLWHHNLRLDIEVHGLSGQADLSLHALRALLETVIYSNRSDRSDPSRGKLDVGEGFAESLEMLLLSGS